MSTTTTTAPPAVQLRGLTKRYGGRTVVDGLTLDVPAGVVAAFVGPNGAGKTTTMAMLLGLVAPSAGTGTVLGASLDDPTAYLSRVGASLEGPAFYPGLSGRQNLEVLAIAGGHDPGQAAELLEVVGLGARGEDRYRGYSFGMKQRLAIAATLLGDPRLLVLDEPINGLDPAGVLEVRHMVRGLRRADRTVVVSSHLLAELEQVCDWLIVLSAGRLVFHGPADALREVPPEVVLAPARDADLDRLADALDAAGLAVRCDGMRVRIATDGREARSLAVDAGRAAWSAGVDVAELGVAQTSLEDRYLALVGEGSR